MARFYSKFYCIIVSALLALAACGTTLNVQVKRVLPKASEQSATLLAGVGRADRRGARVAGGTRRGAARAGARAVWQLEHP